MKIAFHNVYEEINKDNFLFENIDTSLGDELLLPFHHLKEVAKLRNIECGTTDAFKNEKINACVFIDYPKDMNLIQKYKKAGIKLYLLIFESRLINKKNWELRNHNIFEKIFTWCDDLVDNKKYFKINFSQRSHGNDDFVKYEEKKLVTLIASNKLEKSPGELYSKRIEIIRWFEKNHIEDFDLYGFGWNEYRFSGIFKYLNVINKLPLKINRIFYKYESYRGSLKNKRDVLRRYKYSICFENFTGVNGYITEKIFDCFLAGVVPVYWGADNVHTHIPENCFIDYRKFRNAEELYKYIKKIEEYEYNKYLDNIASFLKSEKFKPFSLDYFAKALLDEID